MLVREQFRREFHDREARVTGERLNRETMI